MNAETGKEAMAAEAMAAKEANSAEKPAAAAARITGGSPKCSPLSHLTTQSARFGVWEVVFFQPRSLHTGIHVGLREAHGLLLPVHVGLARRSHAVCVGR